MPKSKPAKIRPLGLGLLIPSERKKSERLRKGNLYVSPEFSKRCSKSKLKKS